MRKGEVFTFGFRGFPGVQGGIETHVEQLAPRLVELGYRVTACTRSPYMSPNSERMWKGVSLLRLWTVRNKYLETLLHSLVCAIVAGIRRPEIVHVHGIGPAIVTPLLRVLGLRVVVTHHGEDYKREKWGLAARSILYLGEVLGMRLAQRRIAVSRPIAELIASKYGCSCETIPNGVVFPEMPLETNRVEKLGLVPGRYVLTVGRLVTEKRQLDLLQAFRKAGLQGWKLAIVGRIDHENTYADRLASEAAVTEGVVMAGYQSGETLNQLYAHAGVFVLPSSHEGCPIALLEALSYGLPTLVSDIPASMEAVSDPACRFNVGDIGSLSSKLASFAEIRMDASEREAVRREKSARYNWSDIARRTAAVYSNLAEADDHSAPPCPISVEAKVVSVAPISAVASIPAVAAGAAMYDEFGGVPKPAMAQAPEQANAA
jgi:glycosyltransferase involved in cell wall biosynthesis